MARVKAGCEGETVVGVVIRKIDMRGRGGGDERSVKRKV